MVREHRAPEQGPLCSLSLAKSIQSRETAHREKTTNQARRPRRLLTSEEALGLMKESPFLPQWSRNYAIRENASCGGDRWCNCCASGALGEHREVRAGTSRSQDGRGASHGDDARYGDGSGGSADLLCYPGSLPCQPHYVDTRLRDYFDV